MESNPSPRRVVEGKYTILEPLPTHGSSRLFAARQSGSGRPVVLREFTPVGATVDAALAGLSQVSGLASRFITELVDAARVDTTTLYVVHPKMTGESLVERLARKKTLDVQETSLVAARLLRGLEAMHARGLVHGGVRPSRVFHERSPKRGWHIKLLGAGVASVTREEARQHVSLLAYMPPEWLEGGAWTAASDLWCVGSIIYTCLVGRTAFEGKNAAQVEQRVRDGEASPLTVAGVTPELEALIMSALARDPSARPASARAFSEQLHAMYPEPVRDSLGAAPQERWTRGHFVGKPVAVESGTTRRRAPNTGVARRKRRTAWQAVAVVAVLVAAVALFIGGAGAARRQQPGNTAQPPPATLARPANPPPVTTPPPVVAQPAAPVLPQPPSTAPDAAVAVAPPSPPPSSRGTTSSPVVARITQPAVRQGTAAPAPAPAGGSAQAAALLESNHGVLDFRTATTCRFMLDGVVRGEVNRTELILPAGTHRIGCGVGRDALHLTVRVEAGRRTRVHANSVGDTEVMMEQIDR